MQPVSSPRIFYPGRLAPGTTVTIVGGAASHLARVLRLHSGDTVVLFAGDGLEHTGTIQDVRRHEVDVLLHASSSPDTESRLLITLVQALCRGARMDAVIQKAAELGVSRILPVYTERTGVRLHGERVHQKTRHWRGVAVSACEQCGRVIVPEVLAPQRFARAVEAAAVDSTRLLLDPSARSGLSTITSVSPHITVLVGPEGGFTRPECELAQAAGFQRVRLGPRILRAETAPIAALSIIQNLHGDLGGK
jgi:16S rRNA (uracil1498-N3)-methyltransferase